METHSQDIIDRVRDLCGDTAQIRGGYGGLEIQVTDEAKFPWAATFHTLSDSGQDVWMRRGPQIVILTKPPAV